MSLLYTAIEASLFGLSSEAQWSAFYVLGYHGGSPTAVQA